MAFSLSEVPIPLLSASLVSLFFLHLVRRWTRRRTLPPGPKGKFIIGNILDMPKSQDWVTYAQWSKKFDSDVLYLNLAGQSLIILNSLTAVEDLFERRSGIYSSRPGTVMLHKLIGWDFSFIFMKYGPAWREHRKFMYQRFNPRAATNFKPHVLKAIHSFMRNILASPENLRFHAHHFTIESMLSVTYGIQVQTGHNPVVELLQRVSDALVQASIPGRFLVDSFPFLQYVPSWIPFTQFKRDAKEWNKDLNRMIEEPFQITRNHFLAGEDTYSFVSDGLRAMKNVEDQPEQDVIKKVAGTLYFAASDTTFATIMTTILALMCHPEVMKKAQAEIDTIVEPGNLPDWKDQESLPYTSAVIKEILRWNPAIPLDLHYIECEDVYRGFTIPSNSIVLGNAWAILHEESVYPNPASFNPDRFIKNGKLNTEIRDPEDIAFGIGRRICPGRHLARPSVWMLIACIITLFDISKPVDEEGNVIEPKMEWTTGSISHPVPFQCRIVPRSEKAVAAIQATKGYEYAGISG